MTWNTAAQAHLAGNGGYQPRWGLWLQPLDRDTQERITVGIWDGDDDATITVDGDARVYIGAQAAFEVASLIDEIGTGVRSQSVKLSGLDPAVETLYRGYDLQRAPAELHLFLFNPVTQGLIDMERRLRGIVSTAKLTTGALGGQTEISLVLATSARDMTTTIPARKSDEAQSRRGGDRFRRYGTIADGVSPPWGSK